jgi:hypothetical protein
MVASTCLLSGLVLAGLTLGSTPLAAGAAPSGACAVGEVLLAHNGGAVSIEAPSGCTDTYSYGSLAGDRLNSAIVGIAALPGGGGYWLVGADGGVFTFGDAQFYGSTGGTKLNAPIVGIAATPDGRGYWLVASDGGIFAYGDAQFYGSTGGMRLNQPIVGMAADGSSGGYWLVASDGGVFAFNAPFLGSMGGQHLNAPMRFITGTPDFGGYRMVAGDGGVFNFGDAASFGSAAAPGSAGWSALAATPDGGGYWLFAQGSAAAGAVVAPFGDASTQLGSAGGDTSVAPIVGAVVLPPASVPLITVNPTSQVVEPEATVVLSAAATASPVPSVQWQASTNGGATFANLPGVITPQISFTATPSESGYQYRAVFTNVAGSTPTTAATLTVGALPTVTLNPSAQKVASGATATFSAAATGNPTPILQWQVSTNGGTSFSDLPGVTSSPLSFTATTAESGYQYRAVFANADGVAVTAAALLTVGTPPTVTLNPSAQTVASGSTATFSAAATGDPAPFLQWQVSTNGGTSFSNLPGVTSSPLSFTATTADSGYQYRAVFANADGVATTTAALLTVG